MFSSETLAEFVYWAENNLIGQVIGAAVLFLGWWIPTLFNRDFWKYVGCTPHLILLMPLGSALISLVLLIVRFASQLTTPQLIGAIAATLALLAALFFAVRYIYRIRKAAEESAK